jgi:2,5-furandicarboxylate decarboxylase 1
MTSLRDFLDALPEEQLFRIQEPLSLDYVPTAIVLELEEREQSPVIYIEHPIGYDMPVVANLFGSRERIARIAGVASPTDFNEAWQRAQEKAHPPTIINDGPVQELVLTGSEVDVSSLPISRHFAQDAGQYIGSGILVCKDPDTGVRNLSYQRLQKKGPNRFGASLHSRGHIWEHLLRCEELGQNLEVAVVLGAHPVVHLAAAARVAKEVDEYDLAGGLLGEPVELVRAKTIDVEVPANAEIVLEGEILAGIHEDEGPYGEYTGYSTSRSTRNVFVVKAITRRAKPIFLDIIPGYSAEHLLLGRAAKEAHVFQRLKEVIPAVRALNYPQSGTHFHAYISLKKTAEGQARHALLLLFGLDSYIKFAVAVDDDIDVYNEPEVLWALATRFQADTDLFVVPKVFCNRLDPSSIDGMSAKMGLDATAPLEWDVERTSLPAAALDEALALLNRLRAD